jgi:phasin family protein
MTSLPEQLSAARSAQLEAQFTLFRHLTTRAFDSASRVIALNISTSRDSVERSSQAVRQLIAASGPADLAALREHAEDQMRSLFSYSRELFSIVAGAQAAALRPVAAPLLAAPAPAPAPATVAEPATAAAVAAVEQAVDEVSAPAAQAAETVAASTQETVQAAAQAVSDGAAALNDAVKAESEQVAAYVQEHVDTKEPAVVAEAIAPVDEPAPMAKPKPIARAAGKGAPKAAVAPHPAAAPVADLAAVPVPKGEQGAKRKK